MRASNSAVYNALMVLITIVVFVLCWKIILPNYFNNKAELNRLTKEVDDGKGKLNSLMQTESDLKSIQDVVDRSFIAVPKEGADSNTLAELEAIAIKNGVVIPSITIAEASSGAPTATTPSLIDNTAVTEYSVSFSAKGSFEQLSALIAGIEKSVKFMNIKTLNLTVQPDGSLALSTQFATYAQKEATDTTNSTTNTTGTSF